MKINDETFKALKLAIITRLIDAGHSVETVTAAGEGLGFSRTRIRWDLLHASDLIWDLYAQGLNDEHIDTALRRIFNH